MTGRIDQNQGSQDARLGKWQRHKGFLEGQSDETHGIGGQFCSLLFGQSMDVQAVYYALDLPLTQR